MSSMVEIIRACGLNTGAELIDLIPSINLSMSAKWCRLLLGADFASVFFTEKV